MPYRLIPASSGKLTRAVLALALAMLAPALHAQVSPGPLSKAHAELNTPLACAKCHVFGAGAARLRCLECHQEIARRITEKRGYHAAQVKPASGSDDCARCHSEHNGAAYRLVRWPGAGAKDRFDHAQAGWKLEGKHSPLRCAQCHTAKFADPQDRAALRRRDPNSSYATLNSSCASCHRDIHNGQLSERCNDCHSIETWKQPPRFDHQRSRYPLTGLHAKVDCAKCHRRNSAAVGTPVMYRAFTMYEYCTSCHRDPHGNVFGGDCARCHITSNWRQIAPRNGGFDHSRTKFALDGKHSTVACKECHKSENFRTPVAFARCLDCHKDMHDGQFARRQNGGDCKDCHDASTWKKARFTVADHAHTDYPLVGKHSTAPCEKCHLPKGKATIYRVAFAACTNCHQDRHGGQFAATTTRPGSHGNRCEDCHDTTGWAPSTFTLVSHDRTAFALRGAHRAVDCELCHTPRGADTPYHPASAGCTDCHANPHGKLSATFSCEGCHTVSSWKELGRFDHNRTRFALLGRHAAVACLVCHKPTTAAPRAATLTLVSTRRSPASAKPRNIAFQGTATDCAGCHDDVHDHQFRSASGDGGCARCHTTVSWKPTEFDHGRHSAFALDGAHQRVPCRLCHDQRRVVNGRTVIAYMGTPRECKQCHR